MPNGYHHVTRDLRCQIKALTSTAVSMRQIAKILGVSPSTISREIKRNSGQRGYRIKQADSDARTRRSQASQTPKKMTNGFVVHLDAMLRNDWSPEQISGRLANEGVLVSHETIYRHIWANKRAGGKLYTHLRHRGKRYNKRTAKNAGRGCIPNRVDISKRPAVVDRKKRIGDWEADTVISAGSRTAILTIVERHSKLLIMEKIGRKTAENVRIATKKRMSTLPHPVLTITYDNGKEFAAHKKTAADLNASCYFATPYHSWERGLNEHTNGLIRQYLAKHDDFKDVTIEEIREIENRINNRPRKVLKYKTPYEVFHAETQSMPTVALRC
jgi:IS30 family transposase